MASYAEGALVDIAYKKETTWGVAAGASGGKLLRRVETTLDPVKSAFGSQERRPTFQRRVSRHGSDGRSEFSLPTELFGGAYEDFIAAICRRAWTDGPTATMSAGDGVTIASNVITRAAGGAQSFLTDGFVAGMVVRMTGLAASADNNRNLRITAVTATTMTVVAIDGVALTDVGSADENVVIDAPGAITYIPLARADQTYDSFTIERRKTHRDATDYSTLATGVVLGTMEYNAQPNQMISLTFSGMGALPESLDSSASPYFTSPTAVGTTDGYSTVPGVLALDGVAAALSTAFSFTIDLGLSYTPTMHGASVPLIELGVYATVTGRISRLVTNTALFDAFINESEGTLHQVVEAPVSSGARPFFSAYCPRIKYNSNRSPDATGGLIEEADIDILEQTASNGVIGSSILFQDSEITVS